MRVCSFELPGPTPDAFLDLPHVVYATDPQWIPEDRDATARAFSRDHDWFATGRALGLHIPGRARRVRLRQYVRVPGPGWMCRSAHGSTWLLVLTDAPGR